MDRSVGALTPEFDLIMAGYLALNPEQEETARLLDRIGGEFLDAAPPQAMQSDARNSVLERIGHTSPEPADVGLPLPVRACIDGDVNMVRWRRVLPWLAVHRLPVLRKSKTSAATWLLKIRRGYAIPSHTHWGQEMTLVLQGGYSDCEGRYKRGDLSIVDAATTHRPVADPDEACVVMIAYDKPQRLTGPVGRLIERFRTP